jgi:hypothetical protein
MKELIEKISSYNLFNYLLPGVIFAVIATDMSPWKMMPSDIIVAAFLCYFYGLVISRLGSLLLQPAMVWLGMISPAPYEDFVAASAKDESLTTLSEQNNTYRTLGATFIAVLVLQLYVLLVQIGVVSETYSTHIGFGLLAMLFIISYAKQTSFITKRIAIAMTGRGSEAGKGEEEVK